jgi:hypothetical protein
MLGIISRIPSPDLDPIKELLFNYLLTQKSSHFTWSYWNRASPDASAYPYPDDLDDTFIALSAIVQHRPSLIDEEAMVSIVNTLIQNESEEGGPYHTWHVPSDLRSSWSDIDVVVNSNVMHFLSLMDIKIPNLVSYIDQHIISGTLRSKYYRSSIVIIYFISKWYNGDHKDKLVALLNECQPQTDLEAALFISAQCNLDNPKDASRYIDELLTAKDYFPYPLFIERIQGSETYWSGCAPLTCVAIIEALTLYERAQKNKEVIADEKSSSGLHGAISEFAYRYPGGIQQRIIAEFTTIEKIPMVLELPSLFLEHIDARYKSIHHQDCIDQLILANALGWIGYTLYDDIMDGDRSVLDIPTASICIKEVSRIFQSITSSEVVFRILNGIDTANYWEHAKCKRPMIGSILSLSEQLPDYSDRLILAQKSLGVSLAPLILILISDHSDKSREADALESFFRHYLIARQLNDDAHDWLDDLKKGFLNSVSVIIINQYRKIRRGVNEIDLVAEQEAFQKIFWHSVIDQIASDIFNHIELARNDIMKLTILTDTNFLSDLLIPLERSAEKAINDRDSALRFLKGYTSGA